MDGMECEKHKECTFSNICGDCFWADNSKVRRLDGWTDRLTATSKNSKNTWRKDIKVSSSSSKQNPTQAFCKPWAVVSETCYEPLDTTSVSRSNECTFQPGLIWFWAHSRCKLEEWTDTTLTWRYNAASTKHITSFLWKMEWERMG